ncbi:MAG: replication-associated recombination protein A [Elusimicrobiales bacterium]|nr:replication-associated recombination protein A [Elusimicrobiales bacterium]
MKNFFNMTLLEKMLPNDLNEFVGQKHLIGEGKFLRKMIEKNVFKSCLFYGPSGTGKTALAKIIAKKINADVFKFNATITSISDIRKIIEKTDLLFETKNILIIIDEIHHFNRAQQDVLLPFIEEKNIFVIGITNQNPFFYVNKALLSRFLICEFKSLSNDDLNILIDRIICKGYNNQLKITEKAREFFIKFADGDARKLINFFEAAAYISNNNLIDENTIKELSLNRYIEYDKKDDQHYDVISAFIKSMRGSDPDATLYWLARMLYSGEDPLFIARRIAIAACEDVGLANPMAILVANSCYNMVEKIGMPESRIILSYAALYVALSPKSNSAYLAIEKALDEVRNGLKRDVPLHLKDPHLDSNFLGDGKGYKYPHDYPNHYVEQQYMPDPIKFYEPTEQGNEAKIKQYLDKIKGKDEKET